MAAAINMLRHKIIEQTKIKNVKNINRDWRARGIALWRRVAMRSARKIGEGAQRNRRI